MNFLSRHTIPCAAAFASILSLIGSIAHAETTGEISGTVHNLTANAPSSGDLVLLLRLENHGMSEEARTVATASGSFRFSIHVPDAPRLVRVIHQGVDYDQQASAGDVLSIDVFDAARKLQGISETIEIIRTGTRGKFLHVSDMHEVENESQPPRTLSGRLTFDVYLLPGARIDSVFAAGPGTIATAITASAVPGEPGHFVVQFPLRPGSTKFAFNYDAPYPGRIAFPTRHAFSLQQLAIMTPPTMQFSSPSSAFALLPAQNPRYQVHAANFVAAGVGPSFEVGGSGDLPLIGAEGKSQEHAAALHQATPLSPSPAATLVSPARARERLPNAASRSFLPAAMAFFLLAVCVFLVWQTRQQPGRTGR